MQIKKWFYGYTNGGIKVKSFKKLCRFSKISLRDMNEKIKVIGQKGKKVKSPSIDNPKLPFILGQPSMGTVIGAQTGDASLTPNMWIYYNTSLEMLNSVDNAIKHIFGDVKTIPLFNRNKNKYGFQYPPTIARVLRRLEMTVGAKTSLNSSLPSIILNGNVNIQREYLKQRFSDEGNCYAKSKSRKDVYVICYQSADITNQLRKLNLFKQVKNIIKNNGELSFTPSNTKSFRLSSMRLFSGEISNMINKHIPNWLKEDKMILAKTFGIKSKVKFREIKYYPTSKKITCMWANTINGKENVLKFYEQIGFIQTEKMKKMEDRIKRWRMDFE